MNVIFMGRKRTALDALDWLLEQGHQVLVVVPKRPEPEWARRPHFSEGVRTRNVPVVLQADLLEALASSDSAALSPFGTKVVDLVVSYLFPERVKPPLLDLPSLGAVNFHPAPLPRHGGLAGYNKAILDGDNRYGATAHYMVPDFDSGPIIDSEVFDIDPNSETALSLEERTRPAMHRLFRRVASRFAEEGRLPGTEQEQTRYFDKVEFENMKWVDPENDSAETIERKVRAFWYPPYHGAKIEAGDREFSLVSSEILSELAILLHGR